jgi:hypothetical protein
MCGVSLVGLGVGVGFGGNLINEKEGCVWRGEKQLNRFNFISRRWQLREDREEELPRL